MNEIEVLQEAFGFEETPSPAARARARAALVERIEGRETMSTPVRRRPRWALRAAVAVTAAAVVAAGVAIVRINGTDAERIGPATRTGADRPVPAAPPYAKPAGAGEFLENAAWAAGRRPWVAPRPDQLMYTEFVATENKKGVQEDQPNGALVPGQTEQRRHEQWWAVSSRTVSADSGISGGIGVQRKDEGTVEIHAIPYDELAGLDTPDKYEAWQAKPKPIGMDTDALLLNYVLPPAVEAAIFRWLARQPDVKLDPKAANLDGRPAIALTFHIEGYLQQDLLFDPQTYALIGDRMVATTDHRAESMDAVRYIKAGDVFRLVVIGKKGIVDKVGDRP